MNKFRLVSFLIGMAVICQFASCKKNNGDNGALAGDGFRASIEQTGGNTGNSRTHINPDNWNDGTEWPVLWTEGDQILVNNADGTMLTLRLVEGGNTSDGIFNTGTPHEDFFAPNYAAIYPVSSAAGVDNTLSGTTATFDLPATQHYVANSFAEKAMPMVAYSETQDLAFKNVLGGICIPLVGDGLTVTSVVLTSAADEALWGTCTTTISTTGGAPTSTVANSETGKNSLTLDCGDGVVLDATTPTYFCFMVPPTTLTSGFTITIYDGVTQLSEKSTTANPNITRSVISKVNSSLEVQAVSYPFSVSDTKRVLFAPGNLQYQASTDTWRFAEHQYDWVGASYLNNDNETIHYGTVYEGGVKCSNDFISPTYSGWIDFFGPGTWTGNNPNPTNVSGNPLDYSWDDADFTKDDQVGPGYDWYTLTRQEWGYLIHRDDYKWAFVQLQDEDNGNAVIMDCVVILPDDWIGSPLFDSYSDMYNNHFHGEGDSYNFIKILNKSDWAAMEAIGAVLLPPSYIDFWRTVDHNGYFNTPELQYLAQYGASDWVDINGGALVLIGLATYSPHHVRKEDGPNTNQLPAYFDQTLNFLATSMSLPPRTQICFSVRLVRDAD